MPHQVGVSLIGAAARFWRHGDFFVGAAISFYALFSLLPLTVLLLVSLRWIAPAPLLARHLPGLFGGPAGADPLGRIIEEAYAQARTLGWWGVISLVAAASGVFGAAQTAFDRIWECRGRLMYVRFLVGVLIMAASLLIFLGVLVGTMLVFRLSRGSAPGGLLGVPQAPQSGMRGAINVAAVLAQFVIFWTAYRWLPSVPVRWRDAWPGAVVATVVWYVIAYGLGWYLAVVADYATLYHELQAVVALFVWVYALTCSVLFGAEFVVQWTRGAPGPHP